MKKTTVIFNDGRELDVTMDNYIDLAARTNNPNYEEVAQRIYSDFKSERIYATMLKASEVLDKSLDNCKKHLMYGKNLDVEMLPLGAPRKSISRLGDSDCDIDLLHGVIGIATEAGELLKAVLLGIENNKLDMVNIVEEVSDVLWYQSIILKRAKMSFAECAALNIQKLVKRFPDGYTDDLAINRNVEAERAIMESQYDLKGAN
jgi:NTP pyrophosphatase (non-canonical NTP hydrolase)